MTQPTVHDLPHYRVVHVELYRIANDKVEFLLLRRTPDEGGFWQPVTGTIEAEETPLDTLYRELHEEAGILPHHMLHVSEELHQTDWTTDTYTGRDYVHAVELPHDAPITLNPLEHDAMQWLPFNHALEALHFEGNKDSMRKVHRYIQSRQ